MDYYKNISCAGVIVFNNGSVAMVKTHSGNWSFPKGKALKGETITENALRELQEETGIHHTDITLIDDLFIDECNKKGHVNVRYLIAKFNDNKHHVWIYDPNELSEVCWIAIDDVVKLDKLKTSRKNILIEAYSQCIDLL